MSTVTILLISLCSDVLLLMGAIIYNHLYMYAWYRVIEWGVVGGRCL